jgi:hypothetical protein
MDSTQMIVQIDASTGNDTGEFIAILMIVAKSLEQIQKMVHLRQEDGLGVVLQVQKAVFGTADQLYPEPGEMRRRVIAFADRMGFDIREQNFSIQSNATH